MLSNIEDYLDLFKLPISFRYKQKQSFSTRSGAFISIIVCILVIFCTIFFSRDLYLKLNPNVISQEEYVKGVPKLEINGDFRFGLSIEYLSLKKAAYERYLDITAYYTKNKQGIGAEELQFPLCDSFVKSEHIADAKSVQCFNSANSELQGYWNTDQFESIYFYVKSCNNDTRLYKNSITSKTNNSTLPLCHSKEEIEIFLTENKLLLTMYYDKLTIKPNDYEKPLQKRLDFYWEYLNFDTKVLMEVFFKNVLVETDSGVLLNSYKNENMIDFEKTKTTKTVRNQKNGEEFIKIYLLASDKKLYYKRIYMKIQNAFADIGGIISFLLISGEYITSFVGALSLKIDMTNTFLRFETSYTKNKNNPSEKNEFKRILNKNDMKNKSEELGSENHISDQYVNIHVKCYPKVLRSNLDFENFKAIKEEETPVLLNKYIAKKKTQLISLRKRDYWRTVICNCCNNGKLKKTIKITDYVYDRIMLRLDYIYLLNMYQEMEYMKKAFFTDEENIFFHYPPNLIDYHNDPISLSKTINLKINGENPYEDDLKHNFPKMIEAINKITSSLHVNELHRKIMDNIDDDILEILTERQEGVTNTEVNYSSNNKKKIEPSIESSELDKKNNIQ